MSDAGGTLTHLTPEDELDELMRPSSPLAGDEDEDELPPTVTGSEGGNNSASQQQETPAAVHALLSPSNLRTQLVRARKLATRARLRPYQVEKVEAFVKADSHEREVQLFIQLCATEDKLDAIVSAAPPFAVSDALLENIKSHAIAVLLSSKLAAYKGSTPCDHVYAVIIHRNLHIPANLAQDTHAKRVVNSEIQEELTQARARVKKAIKASIGPSTEDSESIYDLASAVVANTSCKITVPLCARLALLRKIYVLDSTPKFWDSVDTRLLLIRTKADKDEKKIAKAFERILDADRAAYGDKSTYMIPNDHDVEQESVDVIITGA